ncbi:hypothetical protein ACIQWA_34805 [Kitasatospora sp. NPDC098652]|uniref:hypothetical protein n=1 Tax=Kitasatospora sp. NPDC098652 TaxID=3364095 RepID=UPI0038228F81
MSNDNHRFIADSITVNYNNYSPGQGGEAIGSSDSSAATPSAPGSGSQNSVASEGDPSPARDESGWGFYQDLFIFLLVIAIGLAIVLLLSQSLVTTLLLLIAGLAGAWAKIHKKE